jgi:hypothetical protein
LYQQLVILSFIKENVMSMTKSNFDAELMNNEEQEVSAMYYYELQRRQQLWFESLANLTEEEKMDYLNLDENHWFSDTFNRWMISYREHNALMLSLRPQIAQLNRKAETDMNISDEFAWMNVEANRSELINRNSDLI